MKTFKKTVKTTKVKGGGGLERESPNPLHDVASLPSFELAVPGLLQILLLDYSHHHVQYLGHYVHFYSRCHQQIDREHFLHPTNTFLTCGELTAVSLHHSLICPLSVRRPFVLLICLSKSTTKNVQVPISPLISCKNLLR